MPTWPRTSIVRGASGGAGKAAMQEQNFADLLLDRVQRIERGHRLLEHDGDVVAAHAPHVAVGQTQQFAALEGDGAGRMPRRRVGQQLEDRQSRHRFAGARLADQRHGLALADVERDPIDGECLFAAMRPMAEGDGEVADGEEGFGHVNVFRGSKASRTASPMKIRSDSIRATVQKPASPSHGACTLALPWDKQLAERRRTGRQAEAEEVERGQRHHRRRHDERQERHRRHHGVGQEVAEDDDRIRHAERARRLDVFEIAAAQELGAHQADQPHPGEQQQDAEQHEEARHQHRRDDEQEIQLRHRRPDFDEALEQKINPAAEIALHGAGGDADDRGYDRQNQPEQHRDAEAVDEAGQHIAALIVGAEPIVFEVAAAIEALALHHRFAFRRGEQPGRFRRRRGRQVEIVGGVRVADRRPDHAAALVGDQLLHKGIAIVRRRFEVAAKRGFRIGEEHREVGLAVEAHVERLVVGDEFRE